LGCFFFLLVERTESNNMSSLRRFSSNDDARKLLRDSLVEKAGTTPHISNPLLKYPFYNMNEPFLFASKILIPPSPAQSSLTLILFFLPPSFLSLPFFVLLEH
jgi:hypothetical protein